jgi:hypothetical protein
MANGITKPSDIRPRGQKLILSFDEFQRDPTQAAQPVGAFDQYLKGKEKKSLAFDPGTDYPLAPGLMPIGPSGVTTGKPYKPPTDEFRPDAPRTYVRDRTKEYDETIKANYSSKDLKDMEALLGTSGAAIDYTVDPFVELGPDAQYEVLMLTELGPRARGTAMKRNIDQMYNFLRGQYLLRYVFGHEPTHEYNPSEGLTTHDQLRFRDRYVGKSWAEFLKEGLTTPASEFYKDTEALQRGYLKALEVSRRVVETGSPVSVPGTANADWENVLNEFLFRGTEGAIEPDLNESTAIMYGMSNTKRTSRVLERWKSDFELSRLTGGQTMDFLNWMASKPGTPLYVTPEQRNIKHPTREAPTPATAAETKTPATVASTETATKAYTPETVTKAYTQAAPVIPKPVTPAAARERLGPITFAGLPPTLSGRPPAEGIAALPGMGHIPLSGLGTGSRPGAGIDAAGIGRAVTPRRRFSPSYKGPRKPLDQWVGSGYQPLPPGPSGLAFPHRQPWI